MKYKGITFAPDEHTTQYADSESWRSGYLHGIRKKKPDYDSVSNGLYLMFHYSLSEEDQHMIQEKTETYIRSNHLCSRVTNKVKTWIQHGCVLLVAFMWLYGS